MRFVDIIEKKRDGYALTQEEISFWIRGYVDGSIPDYQVSALCMAIYYQGMNDDEQAQIQSQMRAIYTACSRARDILYVLSDLNPGSPMEEILDK